MRLKSSKAHPLSTLGMDVARGRVKMNTSRQKPTRHRHNHAPNSPSGRRTAFLGKKKNPSRPAYIMNLHKWTGHADHRCMNKTNVKTPFPGELYRATHYHFPIGESTDFPAFPLAGTLTSARHAFYLLHFPLRTIAETYPNILGILPPGFPHRRKRRNKPRSPATNPRFPTWALF